MKRVPSVPGGTLEHAVLVALWNLGQASVRDVHARVGRPTRLAYTTIAKVLDRLYAKGLVSRKRSGRRFVYVPQGEREAVELARASRTLRQLLAPEPQPAIATLVEAMDDIDPELLDELARAIKAHRSGHRGS